MGLAGRWICKHAASATHLPLHPLTEKECELLAARVRAQPTAQSREALLAQVWGMASSIDTHTLETHIYRLRAKLETIHPTPGTILTEEGNYRWA